jgi:hypothetical protein
MRQLIFGLDCATAGAASAVAAAAPTPAAPALRMNERRSMDIPPFWFAAIGSRAAARRSLEDNG